MYGTALLVTLIAVAFEPAMNSEITTVFSSTRYIHMSMCPVPSTENGSCGRTWRVSIPWNESWSSRTSESLNPSLDGLSRFTSAVQKPERPGPGWKLPPE